MWPLIGYLWGTTFAYNMSHVLVGFLLGIKRTAANQTFNQVIGRSAPC